MGNPGKGGGRSRKRSGGGTTNNHGGIVRPWWKQAPEAIEVTGEKKKKENFRPSEIGRGLGVEGP